MEVSQLAMCRAWPRGEQELLGDVGREVSLAAGEHVATEGSADELYLVVEGQAVVRRGDGKVLTRLVPGSCFGALRLVATSEPRPDVSAATALRLLAVGPAELARLLDDSPSFARWLVRRLVERVPASARAGIAAPAGGTSDATSSLEVLSW